MRRGKVRPSTKPRQSRQARFCLFLAYQVARFLLFCAETRYLHRCESGSLLFEARIQRNTGENGKTRFWGAESFSLLSPPAAMKCITYLVIHGKSRALRAIQVLRVMRSGGKTVRGKNDLFLVWRQERALCCWTVQTHCQENSHVSPRLPKNLSLTLV